jgi:hypothetical protein
LIQNKTSKARDKLKQLKLVLTFLAGTLLYVPITTQVSEMFNIHFTEEDQEATAVDEDNQDVHNNNNEDYKLWNREAVLFLIHQVEELREQLDKGLKKKCIGQNC